MARIWFQCDGIKTTPRELNWGITRLGRGDDNDLKIAHTSVSGHHCEIELGLDFVHIRDVGSTNGTFIDNQRIQEARLEPGQTLRLGDVEAVVERSLAAVTVPDIAPPRHPRSVQLPDGSSSCLNHPKVRAAWHCPQCGKFFCHPCIHHLHLTGRPLHHFCPHCHHEADLIPGDDARKKKSLWTQLKNVFHKGGGDGGTRDA